MLINILLFLFFVAFHQLLTDKYSHSVMFCLFVFVSVVLFVLSFL